MVLAIRPLNRKLDPEIKKVPVYCPAVKYLHAHISQTVALLAEETRKIRRHVERARRTFDSDLDALRKENTALREDIDDATASAEAATNLCEKLAQTEEVSKNRADEYRLKYRRERAAREAAEAELVKLKEEKARLKQKKVQLSESVCGYGLTHTQTEALEQRLRRNMRRPQTAPGSDDSLEIIGC